VEKGANVTENAVSAENSAHKGFRFSAKISINERKAKGPRGVG
jgi:hypothetical protein